MDSEQDFPLLSDVAYGNEKRADNYELEWAPLARRFEDLGLGSDLFALPSELPDAAIAVIEEGLLTATNPILNEGLIAALVRAKVRRAAPAILRRLKTSENDYVQWQAASGLERLANPAMDDLLPGIVALIEDPECGRPRERLIATVGKIGTDRATAAAVKLLNDPEFGSSALDGIRAGGGVAPRELVEPYLDSITPWVVKAARVVLARLPES